MPVRSILSSLALLLTIGAIDAKREKRVYNGNYVATDEYPFMASILIRGEHTCGATIITARHVLSAAHCFATLPPQAFADMKIRTGSLLYGTGGQTHTIKRVLYHAEYQPGDATSPNDIAIVELESRMILNDKRKIIALSTKPITGQEIGTAMGWGHTESHSVNSPNLKQASLKTMSAVECQQHYPYQLYHQQFCTTAAPGYGLCVGDSGGPLVVNGQVCGIVSNGIPCAKGYPDVYTDVFHYRDWIEKNTIDV